MWSLAAPAKVLFLGIQVALQVPGHHGALPFPWH